MVLPVVKAMVVILYTTNIIVQLILIRHDILHTGQCKRTGGCYNELVVAFFCSGGGVKGKKSIPVDFVIYLQTCIYFICDDTWRTDHRLNCSLWLCQEIGDLIHGLNCKSNKVLKFCRDRCFFLV